MFSYAVTKEFLRINRDVYRLANILSVRISRHNQTEQFLRQVCLGALCALSGSLFLVWLGPALLPAAMLLFFAGVVYGLYTSNITELRAEVIDQESGTHHQEILMRGRSDATLENMIAVYIDVNKRLKR